MGIYRDPYEHFGKLSIEMWRACRLIGDHTPDVIRQAAIGEGDIGSALEEHDTGILGKPSSTGGCACTACDTANDHNAGGTGHGIPFSGLLGTHSVNNANITKLEFICHTSDAKAAPVLDSQKPQRDLRPVQEATMDSSYDPCHMGLVPRMKVGKTYDT